VLSEEALIGMRVSESLPRVDLRGKEVTQEKKDGEKILA
jgi:hypothetical protein